MKILPVTRPHPLKNDGALELLFIGTGTAFARRLFQTNFLIVKGDAHIMVDFGMTGVEALDATTGRAPTDIRVVLPTHSHADHIGGLEFLALINRYYGVPVLGHPRLKMLVTGEYQDILWERSLSGGMAWNENSESDGLMQLSDYFDIIHPVPVQVDGHLVHLIEHEGIRIELFRTNHIPDSAPDAAGAFVSYGLLIDDRIFFSGDTKFDRALIDRYSDRAEWMFHDAGLLPNPVHASLPELDTLPDAVRRKMFLVHYPDNAPGTLLDGFAGWTQQGVRHLF